MKSLFFILFPIMTSCSAHYAHQLDIDVQSKKDIPVSVNLNINVYRPNEAETDGWDIIDIPFGVC